MSQTSNDDIIRAISRLEAHTENIVVSITRVEAVVEKHLIDDANRIGSLERARAALWAAIITAKVLIIAGFAYLTQRGG